MESLAGINVNGVRFRYPSRDVLKGVDFCVRPGEFVAILGPNGSGKTTLLRAISGYLRPSSGTVLLDGKDLLALSPETVAADVSVVTQQPNFDFSYSVLEYVLLGRSPYIKRFYRETQKDYCIARKAMAATGLSEMEERSVTELSGGEQRRAAISRALSQEPRLMLLDEPTANLDINYQVSVMALLRTLARERRMAVIAVLHDINLASSYCDRVILMHQGKVFACGRPAEVVTEHNLMDVYGSRMNVSLSGATGRPFVLPYAATPVAKGNDATHKIFVIGGGGSAQPVLPALESCAQVTLGVLNVGDADWLACRMLGLNVVEEEPFSPVSDEALERALRAMLDCDLVLVTRVPWGSGNLRNLEIARQAILSGKELLLVSPDTIGERDYTGGAASRAIDEMIALGATVIAFESEIATSLSGRHG